MNKRQPISEPTVTTYGSDELTLDDAYTQNYFVGASK